MTQQQYYGNPQDQLSIKRGALPRLTQQLTVGVEITLLN